MAKFTFDVMKMEDMVITFTADPHITLHGKKKYIGTHLVTLSGAGRPNDTDRDKLTHNAGKVNDNVMTVRPCEIVVGPL